MNSIVEYHYNRLYPFQKEGVEFLTGSRAALLADDVGVGKTAQALVAAQVLQAKKILVICTASIKYDWKSRAVSWGFSPGEVFVVDSATEAPFYVPERSMFIVNYDIIWRRKTVMFLISMKYDVLICDESHCLKSHTSKRTKAVFGAGGYLSRSSRCWLLTGTPVLNRPEELFTTLKALCPERIEPYSDYITFTQRYCGGHQGTWGWVAKGATYQDELSAKLNGFMLRRERDILPDLPEKIMRVVHLERTEAIERIIFEEPKDVDEDFVKSPAVASIRKKMGLAKIKDSVEYIKDRLDTEEKLVVFAYHKDVIARLVDELSDYQPEWITGETPPAKRPACVRKFREDRDCRVIILNIDAAGTGVDGLQEVCKHVVFVEISYVPGVNQQAMGRIHRNGQKSKTVFDFLVVENSLDECVLQKNVTKSEVVKKLMGDENKIFDFTIKKENIMEEQEYNNRIEVSLTIEVADRQLAEHIGRIIHSQEGVRVLQSRVSFPLWPKVSGVPEQVDAVQGELAADPAADEPGPAKRTRKKKEKPADPMPMMSGGFPAAVPPAAPVPTPIPAPAPVPPAPVQGNPFGIVPAPTPIPVPEKVQFTIEQYKEWVLQAVKKIQTIVGKTDPAQVNLVLGEMSDRFRKTFPQYANAFEVDKIHDQIAVVQMINLFMAEKKISE